MKRSVTKIDPNPPAGSVRRRELSLPIIKNAQDRIQRQQIVVDDEILLAKSSLLGSQISLSLKQIGVDYDAMSLASTLKDAYQVRLFGSEEEKSSPEKEKLLLLLDSCLHFNLESVVSALECKIPTEKTFGTHRFT